MAGYSVYVYGVAPKADHDLPPVNGVEDGELHGVEHADLLALTSRLERPRLAARDLRAHWRVLERAFEQRTVLPVRFGTVMESEDDVRERLLEPNAERLSALLEEMHGLMQLNLKGRYDEDALLREIVRQNPAIAKLRERVAGRSAEATAAEQFRLGQLVEGDVAAHRERDTSVVLEALEPSALAVRAEEVAHPAAFDLAFLVERSREDIFSRAVQELRERFDQRIELRYVGPLPPFSFAQADLNSGGGAWD